MNQDSLVHPAYGTDSLALLLPAGTRQLRLHEPKKLTSPVIFQQKLDDFLLQYPFDLSRPVLVLADKTRLCGYPEYLPLLLSSLERQGMNPADLKIIVAYGSHARQSEEECLQTYGEAYRRYTFLHHDCRQKEQFKELGQTRRGTPIRLRRDLLQASAIITMGAISHHYFAGYGGGRKLIFPGCGEKEAIYKNHGLYLDRATGQVTATCRPGVLDGNPLAEDLFEIEDHLAADLAIHGILDSRGHISDLLVCRGRQGFLDACRLHGENCEIASGRFETVIASCGGYPKDINFIQSHKAIDNAAMFVRDGGLLLVYAECRDGIGSKTFLPWFTMGSFQAAFSELSRNYRGNGGTALAMMSKLQRIRIAMVTSLTEGVCAQIGLERWSQQQASDYLSRKGRGQSLAFIANASLTVRKARIS